MYLLAYRALTDVVHILAVAVFFRQGTCTPSSDGSLASYCAAKNAKAKLNYHVLNGKAIRIMWANRNARSRADKSGNIFIKARFLLLRQSFVLLRLSNIGNVLTEFVFSIRL